MTTVNNPGLYYLGSARGLKADWLRNIQSKPKVEIRVGWLAAAMPPCYSKQATVSV